MLGLTEEFSLLKAADSLIRGNETEDCLIFDAVWSFRWSYFQSSVCMQTFWIWRVWRMNSSFLPFTTERHWESGAVRPCFSMHEISYWWKMRSRPLSSPWWGFLCSCMKGIMGPPLSPPSHILILLWGCSILLGPDEEKTTDIASQHKHPLVPTPKLYTALKNKTRIICSIVPEITFNHESACQCQ